MFKKAKYSNFPNCSVPKDEKFDMKTDRQLVAALKKQIRPAHTVLIIAGMYVKHRKWIQKEIDMAERMKKNIVVVRPRGAERMPKELQRFPQQVLWSTNSIVQAIRNPIKAKFNSSNQDSSLKKKTTTDAVIPWQKEITNSPDFKSLSQWINDPSSTSINRPRIRKNIERIRGTSG
jgi:hypothetical protein